jgi:hypothetical protein
MRYIMLEEPRNPNVSIDSLDPKVEQVFLFAHGERRPSIFNPTAYMEAVVARLDEIKFRDDDYFVIVGPHAPTAFTFAALVLVTDIRTINIMMFDASRSAYVAKTIDIGAIDG